MARPYGGRRRRRTLTAMLAAVAMALTACGEFSGIYDLPLPGGAELGPDPVEMTIEFTDVLDLVPQSTVKFNEVDVGRVEEIDLAEDGWHAEVTILVNREVELPANPDANIKQTSLFGEKYVELAAPPADSAEGSLEDGAHVPLSRTSRNVEVEELLGALSMLLNAGGVEQINTITRELNELAFGNETEIKGFLRNAESLAAGLDAQTDEISDALDGLNRLSAELNEQKGLITESLDDLGPGLESLEQQRGDLVEMLRALDDFSEVAVDTVRRSQEDLVANLEALEPILRNLAETGADLPNALEILTTFPFTDSSTEGMVGDYANLFITFDLEVQQILENFGRHRGNPFDGLPILSELPIGEDELVDPSLVLPLPESESSAPAPDGSTGDSDAGGGSAEEPGLVDDLLSGGGS
ncbi:MCE family protein [Haloechinothrix sp. YIM 98757]|uniref:MCE family protein n=1 Tax=Haloechinothrix aidingensis TaxID=2752311 RepID=A0A838A0S0_9PSEU|nr:MCE family protein [Haloechinothrix aidingensis]MBA0124703.1 MCE family protein [Haloechinothrix aidingensis]